ncbi:MAG: RNA methyltransferase [Thermoleophilaceae bacterium]|nr:RNA methyltransferase [Thermoleophilaceae bacterium]
MILYGRNPVREALRADKRAPGRIWANEGAAQEFDAAKVVADAELEQLCGSPDHQGVCAEFGDFPYADPGSLLDAEDALVICLDQVQDPRNLGAVCRVAESAGAAGVVIPDRRAAVVTPSAAKTSAGAVEHLAIAQVGNIADWLIEAKEKQAWVYGAAADARTGWADPDYRGRVVLVLGSEGKGLRPRVADACDDLIALPMRGQIGSLNVSAAAAVLVYGILQFRLQSDRPG